MVRYARPASPDAEMQHEQAGRPAFAGELFRLFLATRMMADQVAIAVHQIGVGGDGVRLPPPARSGAHGDGAVATGFDLHHRIGEAQRSEEHTSELQSLMRISYAVFCLKKKKTKNTTTR